MTDELSVMVIDIDWSWWPPTWVDQWGIPRDGPRMSGRVNGRAFRQPHTLNWVLGSLARAYARRRRTILRKENMR